MRRVTIIVPQLTPGGTERIAAGFANFLANKDLNVTLLVMYKKEIFYDLNCNIKFIEPPPVRNRLGKFLYIPFLLFFIRKEVIASKPNVVFILGYILLALISLIGLKTKVVVSFRSSPDGVRFPQNKLLDYLYKNFHKLIKYRVDGIIAQTNYAKTIYTKRYPCPVMSIPNFVREITDYSIERKNHIITVGRLVPEKAQEYLIEAFAMLDASDWKLILVGDGPKKIELENQAKSLGVSKNVLFVGFQKDVDYYLSQSKIFVLTSIREGYPNALIEAMAHGLACVSFDCNAGPSEIIENNVNGYLVPLKDVSALAERIQSLIHNQNLLKKFSEKAKLIRNSNNSAMLAERYYQFLKLVSQS